MNDRNIVDNSRIVTFQMFMNLTCLVQRFQFDPTPGFAPTFKASPGLIFNTPEFSAKVIAR